MKNDLLFAYEENIKKEAKRIYDILFEKYKKKEKINMRFEDAVRKLTKKEYDYYKIFILGDVYSFMPKGLATDPDNVYVFVDRKEATVRHLKGYSTFCLKNKELLKNPVKSAEKFAQLLVKLDKESKLENVSLPTFLAETMDYLYPSHHDSMDAKTIVFHLQDAMEKEGYIFENINPIKLRKINNEK